MRHITLLILFLRFISDDAQEIEEGPADVTAKSGTLVVLECYVQLAPSSQVTWTREGSNSRDIYVYHDGFGTIIADPTKYEVRKSDEAQSMFHLRISSLDLLDNGFYQCSVIDKGVYEFAIASLVVLDTPILTQAPSEVREGEYSWFTCSIAFGFPDADNMTEGAVPYVEMYYSGTRWHNGSYSLMISPPSAWSSVEEQHNSSMQWSDDGQKIECIVTVDVPHLQLPTALTVSVLHGVRNIIFEPNNLVYAVGDTITCLVSGNPQPDFVWTALHDDSIAPVCSQQLTLGGHLLGNNRWRCTANNTVADKAFTASAEHSFLVYMESTPSNDPVTTEQDGGPPDKCCLLATDPVLIIASFIISFLTAVRTE